MKYYRLLKESYRNFEEDHGPIFSAALAFYGIVAFVPLIMLVFLFIGIFLGQPATQQRIFEIAFNIGGERAFEVVRSMSLESASINKGIFSLVSIVLALLGVSFLFSQLQEATNLIWGQKPRVKGKRRKVLAFLKRKVLSLLVVFVIALLVLMSFTTTIIRSYLGSNFGSLFSPAVWTLIVDLTNYIALFVFLSVFLVFLFKLLIKKDLPYSDIFSGAIFTSASLTIGQVFMSIYFNYFYSASFIGITGSLIAFMVWAYYSGMIFFFGVEFTKVYAYIHGSLKKKRKK